LITRGNQIRRNLFEVGIHTPLFPG
jgi:hypothetical protein